MRAGTAHPEEETAQGHLVHVYKYLMGGGKVMETYSSQWCSVIGQETAQTGTGNSVQAEETSLVFLRIIEH